MNTYIVTIVCAIDADDPDHARELFAEWLTDPRNVEEGSTVELEEVQ